MVLAVCFWNVRSMLDVEGSVETARQGRDTAQAQQRKVDLVVSELDRYDIKTACPAGNQVA